MTRPRKKSRRKRDSNPGSSALEADALTTWPKRRGFFFVVFVFVFCFVLFCFVFSFLPYEEHRPSTTLRRLLAVFPKLFRAVTTSLHFCLGVSAPCVPGSSPLSLFLWIPGQSLPGDVAGRLPEGVTNPTSLSSSDLCGHWFLIPRCLLDKFQFKESTQALVRTIRKSGSCGMCKKQSEAYMRFLSSLVRSCSKQNYIFMSFVLPKWVTSGRCPTETDASSCLN